MANNLKHLQKALIPLSQSTIWEVVKLEWSLIGIQFAIDPETCPCTHFPIIELCEIQNCETGQTIIVGNHCVKNFIGLPSNTVFQAIKRIRRDITKSLGEAGTVLCHQLKILSDWEYDFYLNTCRKRKMTEKQRNKRIQINGKVLERLKLKPLENE